MSEAPPRSAPTIESLGLYWPLGAMFGTQSVSVILFLTVPVMATEIAPVFGVAAKDISVFLSIVFASAMLCSAASGSVIRRYGGIRANQIGMGFSALCLLLALFGSLPLLYLAAVLVGIGYGPNTPSGAHILSRVTPPRARAFVFSVKQSGAPLGGLIAGLLIPAAVIAVGWQGAIAVSVAIALTSVLAIQPLRDVLDNDRDKRAAIVFTSPWLAVVKVLNDTGLRRLTLVAFCLSTIQAIVLTFLIIILVQQVGLEFTLAGTLFGVAQAAGAALRIATGWFADRAFGARPTLVLLGIASAFTLAGLSQLGPQSPFVLVVVLSVLCGSLSFGWNGVFLAEIASLAGPGDVGTATGGSLFFVYAGIVFGPLITSLLITLSGGFELPIFLAAGATTLASFNLLRPLRTA